jgi:ATP-dependent DNA ligase
MLAGLCREVPPTLLDRRKYCWRLWAAAREASLAVRDAPCAVIGYRAGADGLRDLLLAAMVDGRPVYVGSVELGIRGGREILERLNASRIPRPTVPCSLSARWVAPELACTIRFCGWRRGRVWRDAVRVRWEELPTR